MDPKQNKVKEDFFPDSINDIRDKYFEGKPLSDLEKKALSNYDSYRVSYLNESKDEEEFEKRYLELQSKANLESFEYFTDKNKLNP